MNRITKTAVTAAFAAALIVVATRTVAAQEKTPAKAQTQRGAMFIDKDGDGVCDNFATRAAQGGAQAGQMGKGKGMGKGQGMGQGKGMGNGQGGVCPMNGTGKGPGAGKGVCDGTGPKGRQGGAK